MEKINDLLIALVLTWKTESPFIQAKNLKTVVLPAPETPMSKRWP